MGFVTPYEVVNMLSVDSTPSREAVGRVIGDSSGESEVPLLGLYGYSVRGLCLPVAVSPHFHADNRAEIHRSLIALRCARCGHCPCL